MAYDVLSIEGRVDQHVLEKAVMTQQSNVNTALLNTQANNANIALLTSNTTRQQLGDIGALALNAEALLELAGEQIDAIAHPDVQRALLRINALVAGAQRSVLLIKEISEEVSVHLDGGAEVVA